MRQQGSRTVSAATAAWVLRLCAGDSSSGDRLRLVVLAFSAGNTWWWRLWRANIELGAEDKNAGALLREGVRDLLKRSRPSSSHVFGC